MQVKGDRGERKMHGVLLRYVQKSRKMESDDRRKIYGERARGNKHTSGERLKVHLRRVSVGA